MAPPTILMASFGELTLFTVMPSLPQVTLCCPAVVNLAEALSSASVKNCCFLS
jgi:iron only hydrogenase large subunit-like protein